MKNPLLTFLLFCFTGLCLGQTSLQQKTMYILPQSQLLISGDTNISEFDCNFDSKMLPTNCAVTYSDKGDGITFKNAVLLLSNKGFDCGNRQINKDFHALLQTEEFPSLQLELKKIKMKSSSSAEAVVDISIAGVTKTYQLPVKLLVNPTTCFEGKLALNINDFGLEPPRKAFGLIKVREAIEISFNLSVAE